MTQGDTLTCEAPSETVQCAMTSGVRPCHGRDGRLIWPAVFVLVCMAVAVPIGLAPDPFHTDLGVRQEAAQ